MVAINRVLDEEFWGHSERAQRGSDPLNAKLNRSVASMVPIDLYCWWASLVNFRTAKPSLGDFPTKFPFIAEGDVRAFSDWAKLRSELKVSIPTEYTHNLPGRSTPSRFFTFEIAVPRKLTLQRIRPMDGERDQQVAKPGAEVDWLALRAVLSDILTHKDLLRVQLGHPIGKFAVDATDSSPRIDFQPWDEPPASKQKADVVIGVIDDGAGFAHRSLREPTRPNSSRVQVVWNQSRRVDLLNLDFWQHPARDWSEPDKYWYGSMMGVAQTTKAMAGEVGGAPGEPDEQIIYARLVKKSEARRTLRNRESHGVAVLTTAAGSLGAANCVPLGLDFSQQHRDATVDDAASKAPIIFVDLPFELKPISSGRWMPISALDGVRFIVKQARDRYNGKNSTAVPVVINISSGASAGAHYGRSMFEEALSELLASDVRLAVTVAVGNSRLAHAHHDISLRPESDGEIVVRIPPDKPMETYVEVWPEWPDAPDDFTLADLEKISLSITAPDGKTMNGIQAGSGEAVFRDDKGEPVAGLKFARNSVHSKNRPMALLVVSPTLSHEWRPRPGYGNWIIRCKNDSKRTLRVRSWIERDEIVFGIRRPQLAHFVHDGGGRGDVRDWDDETGYPVSRYETTSNFSNASGVFAVAAGVGGRANGYVSSYSGGGSREKSMQGPMLIARADRSPAQPGMPVFGSYRSARFHMSGTSVAAPHAARWIANNFARGLDRPHIECLVMCSQPRTHPHLAGQAAGEGRMFVEDADSSPQQCVGPPYCLTT